MPKQKTAIAVLIVLTAAASVQAATMRCNGRVLSIGDTKADVVMKCGEPASRDSHQENILMRTEGAATLTTVTIDDWTYDFGTDSLIRYLMFRNNRLEEIREGGYGSSSAGRRVKTCDEPYPVSGSGRSEIIEKCGEPTFKEVRHEEMLSQEGPDSARRVTVAVEEWTYNLGPDRLIRIFEFRNGKLASVRTDGYGQ